MATVFLSALFTKHLLLIELFNITMILERHFQRTLPITIDVLLEVNLVNRALYCLSMYGD